jgi:hypothetical protein
MTLMTAWECLRSYAGAKNRPLSRGEHLLLQKLFGLSVSNTYRRWIAETVRPAGTHLIQLMYLMEFLGYQVEEISRLDDSIKRLGRLFAFGVVDVETILTKCSITRANFLNIFEAKSGTQRVVLEKARELAELHESKLADAQRPYESLVPMEKKSLEESHEEPDGEDVSKEPSEELGEDLNQSINTLAGLLKLILPLAEQLVREGSMSDRRLLRQLAGDGTVFQLSNALTSLCSETARKVAQTPHHGRSS